jgi:5-methylcytosine-specific restriction endonuclease McrA
MPKKVWTEHDDRKLLELAKAGKSAGAICVALNRCHKKSKNIVEARARELGVKIQAPRDVRKHAWTADEEKRLAEMAKSGFASSKISKSFGWSGNANQMKRVQDKAAEMGLTLGGRGRWAPEPQLEKIFAEAVAKSDGWAGVIVACGRKVSNGGYIWAKETAKKLGVDTSHFLGAGHGRAKRKAKNTKLLESYFRVWRREEKATRPGSSTIRKAALTLGWLVEECYVCKGTEWMGKDIPLDLDHMDGDPWNNRIENLRILCRNCHAQTETFGAKNRGNRRETEKKIGALSLDWANSDETNEAWVASVASSVGVSTDLFVKRVIFEKKRILFARRKGGNSLTPSQEEKYFKLFTGGSSRAGFKKAKELIFSSCALGNACSICDLATWRDQPIDLDVDHINGVSHDQRLVNLRLLCKNCHAQTETYGSKNARKTRGRIDLLKNMGLSWAGSDPLDILQCEKIAEALEMPLKRVRDKIREERRKHRKCARKKSEKREDLLPLS